MLLDLSLLPHELLETIAFYLPTKDQYNGLIVCKSWFMAFCRLLYRHIKLTSRVQLKQFLNSTTVYNHYRHFVRSIHIGIDDPTFKMEDCVTGAIPMLLLRVRVGVTSHELCLLTSQLPQLNTLYFDPRLWQYINTSQVQLPNHFMQKLPPLDHPRQLTLLQEQNCIQTLHLRGADMFELHEQGKFLAIFKSLPTVTSLTIDGDGIWDAEYIMQFSQKDINDLHTYLPNLIHLDITNAINLLNDNTNNEALPTSLKQLTLFAPVESADTWCTFLGKKYPALTHLHLNLCNTTYSNANNAAVSEQFTQMLVAFKQLKSLKLHPSMSKQFLNNHTFDKASPTITILEFGLWEQQALTRLKPHLLKAITCLVIPTWGSCVDLSSLQNLVKLEIKCTSGGDKTNSEYRTVTTVALDSILRTCPMLAHLEIHWGTITTLSQQHNRHPLQTLRLNHVSVLDNDLFTYLSLQCSQLECLFLRECEGISQIYMPNTHFKYIVLSELSTYHLELIQLQQRRKQNARWYESYRDKYTFQQRIARLSKEPKSPLLSILCKSIDTLLFNGCKI